MGRWVDLDEAQDLTGQLREQAYCILDCTGTREVADVLLPRLAENPMAARTYAFERALQAPALEMMRRGTLVDVPARKAALSRLRRDLQTQIRTVSALPDIRDKWDGKEKDTGACPASKRKDGKHTWPRLVTDDDPTKVCTQCGGPRMAPAAFNANSPDQVKHLLYDILGAPIQRGKDKKITSGEDALLRIAKARPDLEPITSAVLDVKSTRKQIGFLEVRLSPDERLHSSFNVGAAWTGRFSSSKSPLGGGTNMQNIAEQHRHIFIPDPDFELVYVDLERAESAVVAFLSGDQAYIEAHEGSDTHTYVARLLWPDLGWTGDQSHDKKLAKSLRPSWDDVEGHDYRFQAKRVQHGSNYGLTPPGIAMTHKLPISAAREAQRAYFDAFPHIRGWERSIKAEVEGKTTLVNPLGRGVRLFGRPWDAETYKKGLSFKPQSTVADVLDIALWQIWRWYDPHLIQLLAQVHDAILLQWRRKDRERAALALKNAMTIAFDVTDYQGVSRTLTIPIEMAVGQNWGKRSPENPKGLETLHV